jgi:hemerythrin-like domain-containing protein
MSVKSPFEDLREEHAALLREMQDLHSSVRGLAGAETSSLGGAGVVRDELEMFRRRLRVHFRREEEGLFPEARRMVSEGAKGADVFGSFFAEEAEDDMSAHAALASRAEEMVQLTSEIEDAGGADEGSARKLLALSNLTAGLLQRHAAKEDSLIFPMLEKSLTQEQVDDVRSRLHQIGSDRDLGAEGEEGLGQLGGDSDS